MAVGRRARRVAVWALRIVLGTLAVAGLLLVAVLLALRTRWGGGLVRDLALPRVNDTLAGKLEVADFRYRGRSLELRGVVLRDPEGGKVVELARAWVAFSPLALLHRQIEVEEVLLEQPVVTLERTPRGWNLARALAPRRPPRAPAEVTPAQKADPRPLHLAVHALALSGGVVRLRDLEPAGLPPIHLQGLESEGNVHLVLGHGARGPQVAGQLRLQGATLAPVRAPVRLDLAAEAVGPKGDGSVRFAWGDTRLDLALRSRDLRDADVTIRELRVEPALARRFVRGYPLLPAVEVQGQASLRGAEVGADLALAAAGLRARVEAQVDTARRQARKLRVEARRIDVSELVAGGPASRFDLTLEGQGGGSSAADARGRAELRVAPGGVIAGKPLGPVRARLQASEGRYRVEELVAVLPGLRLTGQGESDTRTIAFEARVQAQDLKLAARSLGLPARLGLAGRGEATVSVRGSPAQPALAARVRLPVLRAGDLAADGLVLSLESRGRALPLQASANLQVASLLAGGRRFGQVAVSARSAPGGDFSVDARTGSPLPLALQAGGRARRRGPLTLVDLERMRLAYPQATWTLSDRARVTLGEGALQVAGLDLRADRGQRLQADLQRRGRWFDAHVVVSALDLARLPPGALPPGRRLGGQASADVRARGRLPGPEIDLAASLVDGRIDKMAGLALEVKASNRPRTGIDAHLRLAQRRQPLAELDAHVGATLADLAAAPASLARTARKVDARVGPVQVQRVGLPALEMTGASGGGRQILRARLQARVAARGTLADPQVQVVALADEARLGRKAIGSARAQIEYRDARPALDLRVDSAGGGRLELAVQGRADLSLPALRRGLQIRAVPVTGRLEAEGQLTGNVGAPHLAGQLRWTAGRLVLAGFGEYRDIDLSLRGDGREMVLEHLQASSGSGRARLSGRALRGADGQKLAVEAKAKLDRFRFYTEGQALGALSLEASASGTVAPDRIGIAVSIPEAHFELADSKRKDIQSLKRPADVVILENGQPIDAREARKLEKAAHAAGPAEETERRVRVSVEADRNLWVRGPDVNLEVGLEPGFVMQYAEEPRLFGTVTVRRGFVQVLGKRFEVKSGSTLQFGGPPDQPTLSVDATYEVQSAGTSVTVHVAGPVDRLTFNLTSPEHPEYGDTELITLRRTGRGPYFIALGGGGAAPGEQAASLLGGLLASRIQKTLAKRLPLDVLLLEPGKDMEGARLEAGTYVGDDLYVAYVGRLGTDPFARENRNEVHLELQLGKRWSLQGTYGDARVGSADLIWTKNY